MPVFYVLTTTISLPSTKYKGKPNCQQLAQMTTVPQTQMQARVSRVQASEWEGFLFLLPQVTTHLEFSDDSGETGVFSALFVQQGHVVVELANVGGVHLQIGTLLNEDVRQSLVIAPEKQREGRGAFLTTEVFKPFVLRSPLQITFPSQTHPELYLVCTSHLLHIMVHK